MKSFKEIILTWLLAVWLTGCWEKQKETDTLVVQIKTKAGEITSITTEGPHWAFKVGDNLHLIQVTNFKDRDGNGVFQPNNGRNPREEITEISPYKLGIGEVLDPTERTTDGGISEKAFVSGATDGIVTKVIPPEEKK